MRPPTLGFRRSIPRPPRRKFRRRFSWCAERRLLIKLLFLVGIVSSFIMMPVKLETYEAGILGTVSRLAAEFALKGR